MPLITGSGLTDAADLMDFIHDELVLQGWTSVTNGASEKWITLPAANTFLGYNITVGFQSQQSGDTIAVNVTPYTPTEALVTPPGSPATPNVFNRILGSLGTSPNSITTGTTNVDGAVGNVGDVTPEGYVLTQNGTGTPTRSNLFLQGGSYLRHWLFTPNNSPLGASEQYVYCVVEVTTGVFRTIGFGEGIKLGASGWDGGLFCDGSCLNEDEPTQSYKSLYFAGGDSGYSALDNLDEVAYILNFSNANRSQYSPGYSQMWVPCGQNTQHLGDSGVSCSGNGPRGLGDDVFERTPAAFSGEAVRLPARFYEQATMQYQGANRMRPLLEYPNIFHTNIGAMTPGETIVDDLESFLVVPYVSKSGTSNSGNRGFLIRHPDL